MKTSLTWWMFLAGTMLARSVHAECSSSSLEVKVLTVGKDGRFVTSWYGTADEMDHADQKLAVINADGSDGTHFVYEPADKRWKIEGAALDPALTADKPEPEVLQKRLIALIGGDAKLVRSKLRVRVVNAEERHNFVVGKATVHAERRMDYGQDYIGERHWKGTLFEHPSSKLLFLKADGRGGSAKCNEQTAKVKWFAKTRLAPNDDGARIAYCLDEDRPEHTAECLSDVGSLDALRDGLLRASLANNFDSHDSAVQASAGLAYTLGWEKLLPLRGRAGELEFVRDVLTALATGLREGAWRGPAIDNAKRAPVAAALRPLCASAPKDHACNKELERAITTAPLGKAADCPIATCRRVVVGVTSAGTFVARRDDGNKAARTTTFEGYAANGDSTWRADYCVGAQCERAEMWVNAEGVVPIGVVDVLMRDLNPDALADAFKKTLGYLPLRAPTEPGAAAKRERPRQSATSKLIFVEHTAAKCARAPCVTVTWSAP